MPSFNRVTLIGNLTRDPQVKYLPSQTPVAEFGLACNRKFKSQSGEDREEVTFVDCSAFGKQAEHALALTCDIEARPPSEPVGGGIDALEEVLTGRV